MNVLRTRGHFFGMTPAERHYYFVNHLVGIESDPFGVEISNLALTLADFPNSDGWCVVEADVFRDPTFEPLLRKARVVFCNPPFEDFSLKERERYSVSSIQKPAELLNRVLDDLHPSGVLGFVMPRKFVDGRAYTHLRGRLAERLRASM